MPSNSSTTDCSGRRSSCNPSIIRARKIYGLEFTSSYTDGGFSTYANFAYSVAQGENWSSSQYLFDPADLAYVKNNYIYLDHDQELTGSFGTSYLFKESDRTSTLIYLDALYRQRLANGRDDLQRRDDSQRRHGFTLLFH